MTNAICSVDTCTDRVHARGWCKMHYSQARNNDGNPLARVRVPKGEPRAFYEAQLWLVTTECKLWPYMLDQDGYGMLKVGPRNHGVHKLACEAWHGARPTPGHDAGHGPCHTRHCFNGAHLSWRTPAEQQLDRYRDGTMPVGEERSTSRLTEVAVKQIRALHAAGVLRGELAQRFGVHHNTIDCVVRRATWRHVE